YTELRQRKMNYKTWEASECHKIKRYSVYMILVSNIGIKTDAVKDNKKYRSKRSLVYYEVKICNSLAKWKKSNYSNCKKNT
ncbi:MAG: hypothetical protein ACK55Z_21345, partial [bacterium]